MSRRAEARAPQPPSRHRATSTALIAAARLVTVRKTTTAGAMLRLASPSALAPDCTSLGAVVVKVTEPPDHGTVHVAHGMAFTDFRPGDPPYLCNARRTPATLVFYQPAPGYTGADTAVIRVFFPNGQAPTVRYDITVD